MAVGNDIRKDVRRALLWPTMSSRSGPARGRSYPGARIKERIPCRAE